jgi:uncharacterized protein (TIGR02996 family)
MKRKERELLGAIFDAPGDDAPRLVYADWLQNEEDGARRARGELIAVQCAIHAAPTAEEHNRLKPRETQLMEHFADAWCAGVGLDRPSSSEQRRGSWWVERGGSWEVVFERGFIETVELSADVFPRLALRLFAREPVRALTLRRSAGKLAPRLREVVHFARLEALAFDWNGLGDPGVTELARSPHLGRLERLRIARNLLTDDAMPTLAAAHLPRLGSLALEGNAITAQGVAALGRAAWAPRLTELTLDRNPLGAIIESLSAFTALRTLSIRNTALADAEWEALVARFGEPNVHR